MTQNKAVEYYGLWRAILAFAGLALLIVLFEGCGKLPKTVEVQPGQYQVPVVPTRDSTEISGQEEGDRIGTIIVPPRADGQFTTIRVYKKATPMLSRTFTNAPQIDVVSDNPAVAVQAPKKPLLWRWALLTGIVAALLWYVTRKLFSMNLWSSAWRLISRAFKRP